MRNRLSEHFEELSAEEASSDLDQALAKTYETVKDEATYTVNMDGEEVPVTLEELCNLESSDFDEWCGDGLFPEEEVGGDSLDELLSDMRSASERAIRESGRLHGMPTMDDGDEDRGDGFLAA